MPRNFRPAYSSKQGRLCPACGEPVGSCRCLKKNPTIASGDEIVRVRRESKGRGGKMVTVITGLPLEGRSLTDFVKKMKQRCGSGGTIKGETVEIQGDHADLLTAELVREGYRVKRSGG